MLILDEFRSKSPLWRSGGGFLQWGLLVSDFDYELPHELVAQRPLVERSASRMLVVDRHSESWSDAWVRDLPERLGEGDCLVVNNSRVLAARLVGKRRPPDRGALGGTAEILVVEPEDEAVGRWRALVRPSRKLRPGSLVETAWATIKVLGYTGHGMRTIEFQDLDSAAITRLLASRGHVPLPPYIRRDDDESDRERYQTVFAREPGSVAAPTAGLHFDKPLLDRIRRRGAHVAEVTLHVGPGTFRPVLEQLIENHQMHAERFEVPEATAAALRGARRTIAVGTTVVRALETAAAHGKPISPQHGETDLFIAPGFRFRAVDALLTNFHLPRSTLLMLVAAFGGEDLVQRAYAHAMRQRYRFYSYGDCMLIV